MDIKKLDSWAEQLLDTGKRNNLVNFKDTKSSSVEVVLPEISSIFEKADSSASFEVFEVSVPLLLWFLVHRDWHIYRPTLENYQERVSIITKIKVKI